MVKFAKPARRGLGIGVLVVVAAGGGAWWMWGRDTAKGPPPPGGLEAFRRGDMDGVLRWANEALARKPDDLQAWELREKAIARLVRPAPDRRGVPGSPLAAGKPLARSHLKGRRPGQAREELERVLARGPDREASWLLSRALLQEGDWPAATAARGQALDFGGDDPTALEPAPYVGATRCEGCHRDRYRSQRGSRHGRTLRVGAELEAIRFPERPIPDPGEPEVSHAFRRDAGGVHMETRVEGKLLAALIEYAVGSGNRGLTFIGRDEVGQMRMSRLSLYRQDEVVALSPMAPPVLSDTGDYLGRPIGHGQLSACLDCHATTLVESGDSTKLEPIERGIGCERCHGPGGNHLQAVEGHFAEPAIARPRLASAGQILRLCGQCHSPPEGETPAPSNPTNIRQQAFTMPKSRCYTKSAGGLSCVTCHDPHRDAETSPAFYEARCLACHSAGPRRAHARGIRAEAGSMRRVQCPIDPARDCLKCHMPKVEVFSEHASYADHHIRVHRERTEPGGG